MPESVQDGDSPLLADRAEGVQDGVVHGQLDTLNRARRAEKNEAITLLRHAYERDPNMSYAEAGAAVGRSKAWAYSTGKGLIEEGVIKKNGHGVEVLA